MCTYVEMYAKDHVFYFMYNPPHFKKLKKCRARNTPEGLIMTSRETLFIPAGRRNNVNIQQ